MSHQRTNLLSLLSVLRLGTVIAFGIALFHIHDAVQIGGQQGMVFPSPLVLVLAPILFVTLTFLRRYVIARRVHKAAGPSKHQLIEVSKPMGPGEWRGRDQKGWTYFVYYDPDDYLSVVRQKRFYGRELRLKKNVGDTFGRTLPDWYVDAVLTFVVTYPQWSHLAPTTDEAVAAAQELQQRRGGGIPVLDLIQPERWLGLSGG